MSPAVVPSSRRAATSARSVPTGVSTPSPRTAAASASTRSRIANPVVAARSHTENVAVPVGLGERMTRAFFSARRARRAAHSGSRAAAVCSIRRISSPTGSSGASGSTTWHTCRAWSSARSRVHSQNRVALGSSSHPSHSASPTAGNRSARILGQIELAARHRARPTQHRGDLVAGELVHRREPLTPLGLRPPQVVHRVQHPRRAAALGPGAPAQISSEVVTGQRRRRQALQGGDQLHAGRQGIQLGRPAGADILVDAHTRNASRDPRQCRADNDPNSASADHRTVTIPSSGAHNRLPAAAAPRPRERSVGRSVAEVTRTVRGRHLCSIRGYVMPKRLWIPIAVVAVLAVAVTTVVLVRSARSDPYGDAWPGSSFGVLVLDRASRTTRAEHDAHEQFRSASLVKLVVALDLLERPVVTDTDRLLVGSMLRASDDDAASVLWAREGSAAIVARTARSASA